MDTAATAGIYTDLNLPGSSLLLVTIVVLLSLPVSAVVGFLAGRAVRGRMLRRGRDVDLMVAETTLGAFLALLGLLLAFTFGNALGYFNERKAAMTSEANAIGTAFLRADLLPLSERQDLQKLLLDYGRTRLSQGTSAGPTDESALDRLQATLEVQAGLWPLALAATAEPFPAASRSFVLSSINDVLDAHTVRIASLSLPISEFANAMMFVSALAAVFLLGNRAGMMGRSLTWRTFFFTGFLFAVIYTVIDTQRATEGLILIDETPLRVVIFDMEQALR